MSSPSSTHEVAYRKVCRRGAFLNMKGKIFISIIIGVIIGYFIGLQKNNFTNSPTLSAQDAINQYAKNIGLTPPPLNVRQQCSDDANRLLTQLTQKEEADRQASQRNGHDFAYDITLRESAYSITLQSCVAEMETTIYDQGRSLTIDHVYDTISGKLLAQFLNPDDLKSSFVPGKLQNPTQQDYYNYKFDLGLR